MSEQTMGGPMRAANLEAELLALAGSIDWPPTPDVATAMSRRLAAETAPAGRRFTWPRLGRAFVLAIVLLLVAVAIAAAVVFGLPGLRISFTGDPLPSPNVPAATASAASSAAPTLAPPGGGLALGTPISPEAAADRLGRPLLVPDA